jgi:Glycosyl hydrolase family 48/Cellulose binding domain/Bacterial Ig domain
MPRRTRRLRAPTTWVAVAGLVTAAAAAVPLMATPAAAATACQVTYTVQNSWATGFTTAVKLTNLGDPQNGWALTFAFPGSQRVDNGWSAIWSQPAGTPNVTARNADWNANLATGAVIDMGFNGALPSGAANPAPTAFALNGTPCTGPNTAPAVRITAPAPGATFTAPATVPITVEALDSDGTIASVEFVAGTAVVGTDTSSPYTFSWTNVPAGSFSLTARATDNGGATTVSAPVGITVAPNTGPALVVQPAAVSVPEGGTQTFSVRLSAAPSGNVPVTVARTAGDTNVTVQTGAALTFTPANFATPQTVTLAAAEDADSTAGVATITVSATGFTSATVTATEADNEQSLGNQRFLELYAELHDPANGYFSPQGIPYHSIETLLVEAPDHGHETTSEAFSYWHWLEATFGRITGDWTKFNNAWALTEQFIIPTHADQPTNSFYNPASPAGYAAEFPQVTSYPSPLNTSVPVGQDPLGSELTSTYGTPDIYGMHWLLDVDNVYGYGRCGDHTTRPAYINTYQRGSQESVWETVPQPSCETFADGGPNGFLDLFIQDSSYVRQWRYTNAPDADARAVQAAYWALTWATAQGKQADVSASVAKAAKLGDYLRYALFDKYFKRIGNCTNPSSCPAGSGRNSEHFLLSWFYAWGGATDTNAGWAWRIGDGASHQGYQNPLAAWALSNVAALTPRSPTAKADWQTSLTRQLQFYQWLQSAEGGIAGGATNSWDGQYATPPAGLPTFFGMAYDFQPVFHDPPSNRWFGFQAWSMERVAEYYNVTGDAQAKAILDKWVPWALANTTFAADGTYQIPNDLNWTGQPASNYTGTGAVPANPGLHVTVLNTTNDIGVAGAYAKVLLYYAKRSANTAAQTAAQRLLDGMWLRRDAQGVSVPETRSDYNRFDDNIFIPAGWTGDMANGDPINSNSTFISIRSFYRNDPQWSKVQSYLDGGPVPSFTYHRFWAQVDVALAYAVQGELFG